MDPERVLSADELEDQVRAARLAHIAKMRETKRLSEVPLTLVFVVERDPEDEFFVPGRLWFPAPDGNRLLVVHV